MITKLKQEIKELNDLIKNKTNQKQSVINRWQYLKHGKEAQVKILEKVKKVIDKMKAFDNINPRFINKDNLKEVIDK